MYRRRNYGTMSLAFFFCLYITSIASNAQDSRSQFPTVLQKSFFGLDVGYMHYPFTNSNLLPGYSAETISTPAEAVRLTLFGYHFTKNFSARITYMRPVDWVSYKNVNGDGRKHTVWMNMGELTAKATLPFSKKLSAYAEGGLALITRHGFSIKSTTVLEDGSYATYTIGGGLKYGLNSKWDFDLYSSYSPGRKQLNQPYTAFVSAGFTYSLHPLSAEIVNENGLGKGFLKNTFQFAYSTDALGYGANHFFAEGKVPVFWGGNISVHEGAAINYRRNVFHTRKTFALDIGASVGNWETLAKDNSFYTASIYPVMRFNLIRSDLANLFFLYSVAGPTYISRISLDGYDSGKHFTFRDCMGLGGYFGRNNVLNVEVNIGHFSNGNIYPNNAGIKVPLSFTFGYGF
jgi:opacity protein-like surface antigen